MQLPIFSEKNYAMHVLASCLVELFPKLQLLDCNVYLDKAIIDFSFSRELSSEELKMIQARFLSKIATKDALSVNEMMARNAKDLLKYHKQLFLTALVDEEEQLTEVVSVDLHHCPLEGEIDLDPPSIKALSLELTAYGEKKWMKRKVWHYELTSYFFKTAANEKEFFTKLEKQERIDHESIGRDKNLFFVEDELSYFSENGYTMYTDLLNKVYAFFTRPVSFSGSAERYFSLFDVKEMLRVERQEDIFSSSYYGLKSLEIASVAEYYHKDEADFMNMVIKFLKTLGLTGVYYDQHTCYVYDYLGRPVICASIEKEKDFFKTDLYLEKILALTIENRVE